jgi:hypothetical protein
MTDGQRGSGQRALTLSLVGLALIGLNVVATQAAPFLFLLVGCWAILVALVLELVAIEYGIVAAQTRSGKLALGIAFLSLVLFGALVLPWFLTGPHNIGP